MNDLDAVIDGSGRFALDLHQQLRTQAGNLFYSPASISAALMVTSAGAAGNTAAEMAGTLGVDLPGEQLHRGMHTLHCLWNTPDGEPVLRLNVANRL